MGAMLGKAFFTVILWVTAAHLWNTVRGWEQAGEVPIGDDDVPGPIKAGQAGFRGTIVWQKIMAALVSGFALLAAGSLLFDLVRLL
jgi:hypothetical protein